jgi:glycosyltransferase involved in cell wall biosynthesis
VSLRVEAGEIQATTRWEARTQLGCLPYAGATCGSSGSRRALASREPTIEDAGLALSYGRILLRTVSRSAVPTTVSVVINNYNYERFLGAAIDSALSQRHSRVEVVVVDDGSTDNSREVIESYGKEVVAIYKPNGGQTSALNSGFEASTGDIVCFLDADDSLYPTAAETAATLLRAPETARCVWTLHSAHTQGRTLGTVPQGSVPGNNGPAILMGGDPHAFAIAPTSSNGWSRTFLESLLPLPEIEPVVGYGSAMADSLMAMASLAFGSTRATSEVHGLYRLHGHNDLAQRGLYSRMAMHLAILPRHFEVVEAYAHEHGLVADADAWKERSFWFRLSRAVDLLSSCAVSRGLILIADEGWRLDIGAPFRAAPFTSHEGQWWGPPVDGAKAVREVEDARQRGAGALAFLWPSYWWLEYYRELADHLRSNYSVVAETHDVIVFDLAT